MLIYADIPNALRERPRWVLWGVPDKPRKQPFSAAGKPASSTNPATWCTFEQALLAADLWGAEGLGFVLGDGVACVDFDHCFDGEELDPWVAAWVDKLGSWTERSQSGTGLHVFCFGKLPGGAIKAKRAELYASARFIALTGHTYGPQRELTGSQKALDALTEELRAPRSAASVEALGRPLGDGERERRLAAALEVDGDLRTLWDCDKHDGDESSRDFALAKALYRALRPCAAEDVLEALDGSPWVDSKDGKHRRKWQRADYRSKTVQAAVEAVTADEAAAVDGFAQAEEDSEDTTPWRGFFTLEELSAADLPPVRWAVPGLLPAGLCLLVAAPKIGKSWLALDLCLSVSGGGSWLGRQAVAGDALYLALEDSPQRLQSRFQLLFSGTAASPARCTIRLQAPVLGQGLEKLLDEWSDQHPNARLVVIDTFQRIRPPATGRENAYQADYRTCAALQAWAMRRGLCLLLVHHTRKALDPTDVFNSISGSSGIFGAADAVLTITKRNRFDERATLSVTGRDVDQAELAVSFDKSAGRWRVLGDAGQVEQDADPVLEGIRLLCSAETWQGSATELMDELLAVYPDADIPTRADALGLRLRRLGPAFRRLGITYRVQRSHGRRAYVFERPDTTRHPAPSEEKTT